jgi:hypothetical protein
MKKREEAEVAIHQIDMAQVTFNILGRSPLIMHRYPFKAWQELIFPSIRENRASLEQRLKHDPWAEFRAAFYYNRDNKRPTLFHLPNGMFHGALAAAALDHPGAKKAQIERLTKITDINIDLYGIPQIFCAMVRNSDISRTPDVRTRPIFPQWACSITIGYLKTLTERGVANLLGAAGQIDGIGDWRGEKGGPFGSFEIVQNDNREFLAIKKQQARAAQQKAYEKPAFFDDDTTDILTWFEAEVLRREMKGHLADADDRSSPKTPRHRRVIVERGADGNGQFVTEELT